MPTLPKSSGFDAIPKVRIGMLVPSSNTALELATSMIAAPISGDVGIHFSRFRVTRIALDAEADTQFSLDPILAAADLLNDAKVSVIAWNGTSASWRGFDSDAHLCRLIEERTAARATSAIVSLNAALAEFGIRKLGLVTPYTADVEAAIVANYAAAGIEIVAAARADLSDNYSFADIPGARVERMCRDVADAGVEAVAIICTNMRGPFVAPRVEAEYGIPVFDSISVTLWGALRLAGMDPTPLSGFGRIFERP
jgi:maleate isomerase